MKVAPLETEKQTTIRMSRMCRKKASV